MKRLPVILLAIALVALPSCKNQNNKKKAVSEEAKREISQKEQYVTEELKYNLEQLIESTKQMKAVPFLNNKNGELQLSEKEKMVKPDYLLTTDHIGEYVTLTQKYRAVAMLSIDKSIAALYDMPTADYEAALAKLTVDVNDPALKEFSDKLSASEDAGEVISEFCDKEYEAGRANLFWEAVSAGLVEQIYICTKNLDKFMSAFDDKTASDVTYNFVCVHENIRQLIEFYPEMESLDKILSPLYVINAISVEQLKSQLNELKGEVEVIRFIMMG